MDKIISIPVASITKLGDVTQVTTVDGRELTFPTRFWVSHGRAWIRMLHKRAVEIGLIDHRGDQL